MIKEQSFLKAILSAFGVSLLAQIIVFIRQILIAAYFGISRELDVYFMTYAIATLLVFTFAVIFDTVAIPHLIKNMEEKGYDAFKRLTGSVFTFSLGLSLILTIIFIAVTPLVVKFMAAGFSFEEKKAVWTMAFYFMPWTLIIVPYYALCSFYKSIRYFNIVFLSEIIISLFSVILIFIYHPDPKFIPIAYFAGYFVAFIWLFPLSFKYFNRVGNLLSGEMKKMYKNFIELFGANQIGSLSSVVERFFQSFLLPGGISALTYSSQMTIGASSLLTFREIFIVPLSSLSQRTEKLEKLIIGLVVITMPVMLFISYYAEDIVTILFKRGRFDMNAVDITSAVLSIYALSLLPSVAGLPVFRMFQVIDRIRNTGIVYLLTALNFALFGAFFVFYLKLGATGIALTIVVNCYIANCLSFYLLHKCGIRPDFARILKYACYSALSSLIVIGILGMLPKLEVNLFVKFLINGCIYVALIAVTLLPLKKRLLKIVYD